MGIADFFRRGALRLILRNALTLEEEIQAHFLDLPEELAGPERALKARHVPNLVQVRPLEARYDPLAEKHRHIAEHERAVYEFFRSLYEKSKIPFVKRAFHFLTQQEEVHGQLLERLPGKG